MVVENNTQNFLLLEYYILMGCGKEEGCMNDRRLRTAGILRLHTFNVNRFYSSFSRHQNNINKINLQLKCLTRKRSFSFKLMFIKVEDQFTDDFVRNSRILIIYKRTQTLFSWYGTQEIID